MKAIFIRFDNEKFCINVSGLKKKFYFWHVFPKRF